MSGVYMYVDASSLNELVEHMRNCLSVENFDRLMRRSMNEVGKRSKKPIRTAVQREYEAPAAFINSGIKSAKINGGGGSVYCVIPLEGPKGNIGSTFRAAGGHRGWNPPKYRVKTRILKGKKTALPPELTHQGGKPPFRNLAAGGLTFTRAGTSRLPIERVSGIALPQMPLNRAAGETQDKLLELAESRVLHNFAYMFGK